MPDNIYVDRILVHQLFQNLISNAIKYSSPQRLPKIIIEAKENDHFWNFTVQDNGIGIAPGFRKKIVSNHDGKIQLTSEVGKGSIFQFSISKNLKGEKLREF